MKLLEVSTLRVFLFSDGSASSSSSSVKDDHELGYMTNSLSTVHEGKELVTKTPVKLPLTRDALLKTQSRRLETAPKYVPFFYFSIFILFFPYLCKNIYAFIHQFLWIHDKFSFFFFPTQALQVLSWNLAYGYFLFSFCSKFLRVEGNTQLHRYLNEFPYFFPMQLLQVEQKRKKPHVDHTYTALKQTKV